MQWYAEAISPQRETSYKQNLARELVKGFRTLLGDVYSSDTVVPKLIAEVFVIILKGMLELPGKWTQLYWVNKWGFSFSSWISSPVS